MAELINGRTPEEIKQALEWMANGCQKPDMDCEECRHNKICKEITSVYTPGDALELIERLEAERDAALAKVPEWISVEERLPDTTNVYLIHMVHRYNKNDGYRCMDVRLFFKGEFGPWQGLPDIYEVTHWMLLPEPPEEEAYGQTDAEP